SRPSAASTIPSIFVPPRSTPIRDLDGIPTRRGASAPLQILLRERQRAHPLAGRRENRVAERGYDRRQCRLAQARGRELRDLPVHLDRRRLAHAKQRERVEVLLHRAAL